MIKITLNTESRCGVERVMLLPASSASQNVTKDTVYPQPTQDNVYFPPNHNLFFDQRFDMHDTLLPPVDYTATSEQMQVTGNASPETSLETLKIALSMVLDSIWQLKSEYQARIEVVER